MSSEIITAIFIIIVGAYGFCYSLRIKKEDIQKEINTGKASEPNYIPLEARKKKGLFTGIILIVAGILYLIKNLFFS